MSKDRIGGAIFLLIGIYGCVFSFSLPFGEWNAPGAGIFPFAVSAMTLISGIFWIVQGKKGESGSAGVDWRGLLGQWLTPLKIIGCSAGFILLLKPLGYTVAASLYMFVLFAFVGRYKIWTSLVIACALGIGTGYFFGNILDIQIPRGIV